MSYLFLGPKFDEELKKDVKTQNLLIWRSYSHFFGAYSNFTDWEGLWKKVPREETEYPEIEYVVLLEA